MYAELLALLSAFCWAAGGILYRKGLETTNVWTGNLIRTAVAATGFILVMDVQGILPTVLNSINTEILFWLAFSAFFAFFVGDIFYLEALNKCGVSRALPVSSTYPLFVAILAIVIYGYHVSIQIFAGSSLIVLAIYLISEKNEGVSSISGVAFAILAAISWSLSITTIDYLVLYLPVEAVAGLRFVIAALLTSIMVSMKGVKLNFSALKWLGIGGVVALVVGNYAFVEAIRIAGSARVTPLSAIYPVIAAVLAKSVLKEAVTVRIATGIVLSFTGVLLVVFS